MYSLLMDQEAPLRHIYIHFSKKKHLYKALLDKLRSIDLIMIHIGMCTMDPSNPEYASLVGHMICKVSATTMSPSI